MLQPSSVQLFPSIVLALLSSVTVAQAQAATQLPTRAPAQQPAQSMKATGPLHPTRWQGDFERFLALQNERRTRAGHATGEQGAVTVAYNGLAARVGLETLRQGGSAMDAAVSAAVAQVTLTAGAPVSLFGIASIVIYDASSGEIHTIDGGWNTVLGEDDPLSIPGGVGFDSDEALRGTGEPSGRTAMVGGFLAALEAGHRRFGRLQWSDLLEPSIHLAERGFPVTEALADQISFREADLRRLPETRRIFLRSTSLGVDQPENGQPSDDGPFLSAGDHFRQPALAATLRAIAQSGASHLYDGPWSQRAIAAIQADGGKMTLDDLRRYEPTWGQPLRSEIDGYEFAVPGGNGGGLHLIEAQLLARAAGLYEGEHWSESGVALRRAHDAAQAAFLSYLPEAMLNTLFPGVERTVAGRTDPTNTARLWRAIDQGKSPFRWNEPDANAAMAQPPKHSDDVVAVDRWGNMVAMTHSINCVLWGKTAIIVDGVTIGDPAAFQQTQIAQIEAGSRLPGPTEEGLVLQNGEPILAFASMGSGLHQRSMQALVNVLRYGDTPAEAIDRPDFFMPFTDPKTFRLTITVPEGRFPRAVLDATGYAFREIGRDDSRFGGEGIWVGIARDPKTGTLRAGSHNRNNSAATAY